VRCGLLGLVTARLHAPQSAALGTIGGILGTSIGIMAVVIIATTRDWTATLNPLYTLPAPTIGLLTGLLAGAQPAWRASRIAPVDALRAQ